MLNKLRVKELYLKGYNSSEIAEIFEASKGSVLKCIQRNTDDEDNKIHKRNRFNMKQAEQAIKRTNNRHISDNQLLKWNRQIYKTDRRNGNIILDCDCAAPIDLPQKIMNVGNQEYKKTFTYSCI